MLFFYNKWQTRQSKLCEFAWEEEGIAFEGNEQFARQGSTDMIFVTSSTSSASVKYFLARVKLSMGNAQSVFFSQGVTM